MSQTLRDALTKVGLKSTEKQPRKKDFVQKSYEQEREHKHESFIKKKSDGLIKKRVDTTRDQSHDHHDYQDQNQETPRVMKKVTKPYKIGENKTDAVSTEQQEGGEEKKIIKRFREVGQIPQRPQRPGRSDRSDSPASVPQTRNFCGSCKNISPDVEFYRHTIRGLSANWLCCMCADKFRIPDTCRLTNASDNARKRIFRREYGATKRYGFPANPDLTPSFMLGRKIISSDRGPERGGEKKDHE